MSADRKVQLTRLRELMRQSRELRREHVTASGLSPEQAALARWQAERLAHTYADLRSQSRYQLAVEFFLSDLYGPRDFTQRDKDVERIFPLMTRVLSTHAISSITLAMELHALSQEFDAAMVRALGGQEGFTGEIDAQAYARAYLEVGNAPGRLRQIELVGEVGRVLDSVVDNPLIYAAIKVAHRPAHKMGFGELQDFVERGFDAFRRMKGADEFLETVRSRETAISERLLAGEVPEDLEFEAA